MATLDGDLGICRNRFGVELCGVILRLPVRIRVVLREE
jgi:hypothetical protein